MAHNHNHISQSSIHYKWSRKLTPALTVPSGTEVTFDLRDGGDNQITPANYTDPGLLDPTSPGGVDFARMDPGFGPVAVEGAEPGDVLRIDVLELEPGAYGWTAILRGFGLLQDDFADSAPAVKIWDLRQDDDGGEDGTGTGTGAKKKTGKLRHAQFKPGIRIPVRPFLGIMGLAPACEEELPTIPPYDWGGNMDCRHLTAGASLWLPVQVAGALFSCGDGHAAQGDGEVCGTAIECPMRARLRLTVEKGRRHVVTAPQYQTAGAADEEEEEGEEGEGGGRRRKSGRERAFMGLDGDLHEAARKAVRAAIAWLVEEKGVDRVEGYMLCSVAADLRIVQAVDVPQYGVVCSIPLSIFCDE